MMVYLLKASLILTVTLAFYKIFLQQEKNFSANRLFLLSGLLLCFVLPLITVPQLIEEQGLVSATIDQLTNSSLPSTSFDNQSTFETSPTPSGQHGPIEDKSAQHVQGSTYDWIVGIYLSGMIIYLLHLLWSAVVLLRLIKGSVHQISKNGFTLIHTVKSIPPCSIFSYILVNPDRYDEFTYDQILEHEKVHIEKMHSLDILLAELSIACFWFNPFVWIYRREIEKNIEFETDQAILNTSKIAVEDYQKSLLEIVLSSNNIPITTHYNHSLLKQRIFKMNTVKSRSFTFWKYLLFVPVAFGFLLLLNKPTTSNAQANVSPEESKFSPPSDYTPCRDLLTAVKQSNASAVQSILSKTNPNCSYYADGEPRSALVAAARQGDFDITQLLLSAGAEVEYHARGDESPLIAATRFGHLKLVQLLIESGAEADRSIKGDGTALIAAVRSNQLDIAKLLLEHGADPYHNVPGDEYAMYHARNTDNKPMIDLLLKYGD